MRNQKRKVGDIQITTMQAQVLKFMSDAKKDGWPALPLDEVRGSTINVLLREGWIISTDGQDGTRYHITFEGERAAKLGNLPVDRRHRDGICPRCRERERRVRSSGSIDAYCTECNRTISRRKYELGIDKAAGRLCARCKKRPALILPGGKVTTYCRHCKNVRSRRAKKRWHKQKLERIRNGEVLLCTKPDCTNPRHHTEHTVIELCHEHYREWHNDYRHRKRAVTPPGKPGRPRKTETV